MYTLLRYNITQYKNAKTSRPTLHYSKVTPVRLGDQMIFDECTDGLEFGLPQFDMV